MIMSEPMLGRPVDSAYIASLLSGFTGDVAGVAHVLALAADGLLLASTPTLIRDQAERLAAAASGFTGLATQVNGELQGGGLLSITVELSAGYLIILEVPGGARLAAVTHANCDVGQVVYQLGLLADRVGNTALSVGARHG